MRAIAWRLSLRVRRRTPSLAVAADRTLQHAAADPYADVAMPLPRLSRALRSTAAALLLVAPTLHAQPRAASTAIGDVGDVGEIVVLGRLQGCPDTRPARGPSAVRIVRGGQAIVVQPGTSERVRLDDAFFVERHTDVQLFITSRELGRGAFTLAPQILCSVRAAYRAFRPYGAVDTASYVIGRAADGALQLGVISGGAIVRWIRDDSTHYELVVVAGGRPMRVVGTEFAVAANATTSTALVHVREGRLAFPEVPNGFAVAGQLVELTPLPPLATQPAQAARNDVLRATVQDVDRHRLLFTTSVPPLPPLPAPPPPVVRPPRSPSLFQRPLTYVVLGGLAAAAGYCGLASDTKCGLSSKSTPSRRGSVLVEIPL